MDSQASLFPTVGDVLVDRYRIESFVARGGMGVVMRASQLSMDRIVAIKMILPEFASNEKTLARFDREVRLAKQLRHPNVVELYDYGSTDNGFLYLVMEFLEGEDLKTVLRREGRLDIGRAGTITLQVLDALSEAHDHEIVHRDIKPSNIFVTQMRRLGDFVKLLDFGIAKSLAEEASEVTAKGEVCGTSSYMAPEMFVQGVVNKGIDVYATGLIFLEMLLGKKVFSGRSSAETLVLHLRKEIVVPEPFAGTPIEDVILRATAKHPRDRFKSAHQFLLALEEALKQVPEDLRVSDAVAAAYSQDLADDSALLEQVLAGPWASGMTDHGSGSSDIVVVPGDDGDGDFNAAVTQMIAAAREEFSEVEEDSQPLKRSHQELPTIRVDAPSEGALETLRLPKVPSQSDDDDRPGRNLKTVALSAEDLVYIEEDSEVATVDDTGPTSAPAPQIPHRLRTDTAVLDVEPVRPAASSSPLGNPIVQIGAIAAICLLVGLGLFLKLGGSDADAADEQQQAEIPPVQDTAAAQPAPQFVAEADAADSIEEPVEEPDEVAEPVDERPEEPENEPERPVFTIRVETEPASASIFQGDQKLGETPAVLVLSEEKLPTTWRLELDGYHPEEVPIDPDEPRMTVKRDMRKIAPKASPKKPRVKKWKDRLKVEKW